MKYSYEFKLKCIELYRRGKWPETPEGVQKLNFHKIIRLWYRLKEIHRPDILKHINNINWSTEQKLEIISKVLTETLLSL